MNELYVLNNIKGIEDAIIKAHKCFQLSNDLVYMINCV